MLSPPCHVARKVKGMTCLGRYVTGKLAGVHSFFGKLLLGGTQLSPNHFIGRASPLCWPIFFCLVI